MDELAAIVVGFLLTTGLGGWWAHRLQTKSWLQQDNARLREKALDRAGDTCASTMSLLDQRLYRMQRLLWAATSRTEGRIDIAELEVRRQEYVQVLFDWNDRLNTNLSLVGSHFGDHARAELETLYEDFKRVGSDIEGAVHAALAGKDADGRAASVAKQFEGREPGSLNDRVYRLGITLMGQLRDGDVGRRAPNLPTQMGSRRGDRS